MGQMTGVWAVLARPDADTIQQSILPAPSRNAFKNLVPIDAASFPALSQASVAYDSVDTQTISSNKQIVGRTVLSFVRPLNGSGSGSVPGITTTPGLNDTVLVAIGQSTSWGSLHGQVMQFTVGWRSGASGAAAVGGGLSATLVTVHAGLMVAAWAFCAPLGVLASRFRMAVASKAAWYKLHRASQLLAVLATAVAAATIYVAVKDAGIPHFGGAHGKVGIVVTVAALLQPVNAFLRPGVLSAEVIESARRGVVQSNAAVLRRTAWEVTPPC